MKILKIKKGNTAAMINKTTPILVAWLSLSIIPEIIRMIPMNPNTTGSICENNKDPVNTLGILSLLITK